jgi:homospermidine synthase
MNKVHLQNKKILFVGYGAVAKATWNHFDMYFTYQPHNVYAVDQFATSFTGPNVDKLHKFVRHISKHTFDMFLDEIGMREGDIIIDLTYDSDTYFFIRRCIELGINYINTSIEDGNDRFEGSSIDYQQKKIASIFKEYSNQGVIRSNILTECGQNPGLIQHYVFYALNRMNQLQNPSIKPDYRRETMIQTLRNYQVGSMFFSEWDDQEMEETMAQDMFTNTWCVSGFLAEALDKAEVVRGYTKWIQPNVKKSIVDINRMKEYQPYQSPEYQVLFFNEPGLHVTLPTISPIWTNAGLIYKVYRGKLIHHGEMFELARYFGSDAPFMTYVYRNNPYMDQSIIHYKKNHPNCTNAEIMDYANRPNTFQVLDYGHGHIKGQDSIGATILCGKEKVDRIFWCGSLFRDMDEHHPYFTPTTVQVAAGVLSGLSYILEDKQANRGWIQSSDINTEYMLRKSVPLLGQFFFTEIPVEQFKESLDIRVEQL